MTLLRRLIDARLQGVRRIASEFVDGLDDRSQLFIVEFADEQKRLIDLAITAFAAVVVAIVAIVWAAATVVALTWDTEWRMVSLVGLLAFWFAAALFLGYRVRSLLGAGRNAFPLSRRVASDDLEQLREALRP
ncbi:MAG: phage holin family protein [Lautropia sp.]